MKPEISDDALLEQALLLEDSALQTLHHRYYNMVAGYVHLKIDDQATAEDVSAEVFVRAIESLHKGRGWHTSPKSWLMGIARNIVVDFYRKQAKGKEVSLTEAVLEPDEVDRPHQHAIRQETRESLYKAMDDLTPEQRDVIIMRFIQGIDIKSVAEAINKTPGAVKALQYRALKTLAKGLDRLNPF